MELWVFFYTGLFLAGLIGVGLGFVVLEVMEYANHGWKQSTWLYQKAIERLALLEESQFNLKYGFMWGRYED